MAGTAEAVDSKILHREILGTTPAGKDIYLVKRHGSPLRRLAFGTGGQLPEYLQGGYSDIRQAAEAVTAYIAELTKEKNKKGKGRSTNKD